MHFLNSCKERDCLYKTSWEILHTADTCVRLTIISILILECLLKFLNLRWSTANKLLVACLTCNAFYCNLLKNYCFPSKWKPLRRATLPDARLSVDPACLPRHMDINIYLCWINYCLYLGKMFRKDLLVLETGEGAVNQCFSICHIEWISSNARKMSTVSDPSAQRYSCLIMKWPGETFRNFSKCFVNLSFFFLT